MDILTFRFSCYFLDIYAVKEPGYGPGCYPYSLFEFPK